ncbi:MAG: proteasome-type protease [Gammaproteobacteria bacterium]
MTYCVAISIDAGLVFVSDSRTNAGVDNVSTYSKMHHFGEPGERQFILLSSGNLATTQAVITQIRKDIDKSAAVNLMSVTHMNDAADYIGEVSRKQQKKHADDNGNYEASFIIGGQITGNNPDCFLIYPQGNHITTSADTPYLQIGESKYGKPILDRILTRSSSLETAALCALVSMDSTMRSNITVGPPIEVMVYHTDSFMLNRHYRFDESSDYLRQLSKAWDAKLRDAFNNLPPIAWSANWDNRDEDAAGEQSST